MTLFQLYFRTLEKTKKVAGEISPSHTYTEKNFSNFKCLLKNVTGEMLHEYILLYLNLRDYFESKKPTSGIPPHYFMTYIKIYFESKF